MAGSNALGAIVPDAFWVHVDDRLGEQGATGGVDGGGDADGKQQQQDEEEVMKGLQESCFMMITGGCGEGRGGARDRRPSRRVGRKKEARDGGTGLTRLLLGSARTE